MEILQKQDEQNIEHPHWEPPGENCTTVKNGDVILFADDAGVLYLNLKNLFGKYKLMGDNMGQSVD